MDNADSNENDGLPKDGIVIPPQDFLNFLGHLSHGAVIGAVTSGALKENHDGLMQAIKDGDMAKVKEQAELLRQGINLLGTVVCRLGKGLSEHDEMVFKHCIKNGVKVTSRTQGLLADMHKDVGQFIDDFLEESETSRFTDIPPHKRKPTDKPADKPNGPSDRFPKGFDFGGSQNTDN
jgi:hypothetical protein